MCEIKFPGSKDKSTVQSQGFRKCSSNKLSVEMSKLTFIACRCEIIHQVAEEVIKLQVEETWKLRSYVHSYIFRTIPVVSHLYLSLFSRVFDGLEDVPGVSPPHLFAGDKLTVPSLNQDGRFNSWNDDKRWSEIIQMIELFTTCYCFSNILLIIVLRIVLIRRYI